MFHVLYHIFVSPLCSNLTHVFFLGLCITYCRRVHVPVFNKTHSLCNTYTLSTLSGVLLYGPPGTGKTLMARACAAQTKVTGPLCVGS